jgi:hypothetical protein
MVMNDLYRMEDKQVETLFSFDEEVLKKALKNIYSKDFHPLTEIEENLFEATWKTINEAADKGFGTRKPDDPDYDFYREIRMNNAVFAAFKVHRAQNDMAALLLDKNGSLKPFEQWVKEAMPIADHQMVHWLRTEYDTAVIRAHQAADWRQFEREKDVLPNLKWMPSTSIHPGSDHRIFWGTIRPIDDPFWNEHRPGTDGTASARSHQRMKRRQRYRTKTGRTRHMTVWKTIREKTANCFQTNTPTLLKRIREQKKPWTH